MKPCVYILKGSKYYVGSTSNIHQRMEEHKRGKTYSTKRIGNFELIKIIPCNTLLEARKLENTIKKSKNIKRWI